MITDDIRDKYAVYLLTGTDTRDDAVEMAAHVGPLLDFIEAQHALLLEASQVIQTNLERMNELRAMLADARRTLA